MADDNSARHRSSDPLARGPASANDPLAELARLIGQNDPFSGYARPAAQQLDSAPYADNSAPAYGSAPAPQYPSEPAPPAGDPAQGYGQAYGQDYGQHQGHDANAHYQDSTPRYAAEHAPRYAADPSAHNDWPGTPAPAHYPSNDPLALPSDNYTPQPGAQQYDNRGYASPSYPIPNYPSHSYQAEQSGYDPAGYPAAPDRQGFPPPLYPQEPDTGSMPPPYDDEFYDDAPRDNRRKGLLTVAAVLGLAVIGTAGAFGYRSMFGNSGSSPPPVIRASGEPSKIAPPAANIDQSANKFNYDRFGDAGKDEQVVRREEKPVDVSRTAARTVFPGVPVANSPSNRPANAGTTATANPPSAIGEPRRVRTVPIRPDQADAAALPAPPQQAMSVAPPRQANAAALPANRQPDFAPRGSRAAAPPASNAPLSLSPDANANALPPLAAQDSAPPPSRPARIASAPASGGGSYLVQVSSQRSEAEAQTAYRGIQSKFSSVLGNQPHTVRRADLGSKGVYYRAMVGPFGSRDEAVQVCVSLKQAGGDCVVQQ